MRKRPRLVAVSVIPWEPNRDIYGLACAYDDGVIEREPWGSEQETIATAYLRARDIASAQNAPR